MKVKYYVIVYRKSKHERKYRTFNDLEIAKEVARRIGGTVKRVPRKFSIAYAVMVPVKKTVSEVAGIFDSYEEALSFVKDKKLSYNIQAIIEFD